MKTAKDYALTLLSRRAYTEKGLFEKLCSRYDEQEAAAAVARMLELRLLDDADYAARLASDLVKRKGCAPKRARYELIRRGIEQETAEEALLEYAGDLKPAIAGIIKRRHGISGEKGRIKAVNALLRLGYSRADVLTAENVRENRFTDVSKTVSDSTVYRRNSEIKVETFKADTVRLMLNPADIEKLPTGASFNQKSGRATINIRQTDKGDLDITAVCDSLAIFYENLTLEYEHYQKISNDSIDRLNKEILKIKSQPVKDNFWVKIEKIVVVIIGIIILLFVLKKIKLPNSP